MDIKNVRNRGDRNILISFAAIAFLFISTIASAEIVRIDITAIVDSVSDSGNYLEGKIIPGSIISGYYLYDSTVPDEFPSDTTFGRYNFITAPYGVFLNSGGLNLQTDLSNLNFYIDIKNNAMGGGPYGGDPLRDEYRFSSYNNLPLSNGVHFSIIWGLIDSYGNALSNDLLPLIAPNLLDWQSNRLIIESLCRFDISSHVISAVPEVSTILLLSSGSLFLLRKRK